MAAVEHDQADQPLASPARGAVSPPPQAPRTISHGGPPPSGLAFAVRTTVAVPSPQEAADRHSVLARESLEAAVRLQRHGTPERATALAVAAGSDAAKALVIWQTLHANQVLTDREVIEAVRAAQAAGQSAEPALRALLGLQDALENWKARAAHAEQEIELAQELIHLASVGGPEP